jgi:hypothetical protein
MSGKKPPKGAQSVDPDAIKLAQRKFSQVLRLFGPETFCTSILVLLDVKIKMQRLMFTLNPPAILLLFFFLLCDFECERFRFAPDYPCQPHTSQAAARGGRGTRRLHEDVKGSHRKAHSAINGPVHTPKKKRKKALTIVCCKTRSLLEL